MKSSPKFGLILQNTIYSSDFIEKFKKIDLTEVVRKLKGILELTKVLSFS